MHLLRQVRSNGVLLILSTSILYLLLTVAVMSFVNYTYDPESIETVDSVFWASLLLAAGTVAVVIIQFCANMYTAKPVSYLLAGLFVTANAFVTILVIKYFANASIGA